MNPFDVLAYAAAALVAVAACYLALPLLLWLLGAALAALVVAAGLAGLAASMVAGAMAVLADAVLSRWHRWRDGP